MAVAEIEFSSCAPSVYGPIKLQVPSALCCLASHLRPLMTDSSVVALPPYVPSSTRFEPISRPLSARPIVGAWMSR